MSSPSSRTGFSRATPARVRRHLRRVVLRHRRLVAAVLASVAVVASLQALQPADRSTVVGDGGTGPAGTARTLGQRLSAAHPSLTLVPIRLPDAAMAELLAPGDRITLLATDATAVTAGPAGEGVASGRPVARGVRVVHSGAESRPDSVMGGAVGRLIIVGVPADSVASVTAASVRSVLTYAWDR